LQFPAVLGQATLGSGAVRLVAVVEAMEGPARMALVPVPRVANLVVVVTRVLGVTLA